MGLRAEVRTARSGHGNMWMSSAPNPNSPHPSFCSNLPVPRESRGSVVVGVPKCQQGITDLGWSWLPVSLNRGTCPEPSCISVAGELRCPTEVSSALPQFIFQDLLWAGDDFFLWEMHGG